MSADLTIVREAPAPFDWAALGWLDQDAQIAYLEAQRREDFAEIQRLRRALRTAETPEPGAGVAAWIVGSLFLLGVFVAGLCLAPLADALLIDLLRVLA